MVTCVLIAPRSPGVLRMCSNAYLSSNYSAKIWVDGDWGFRISVISPLFDSLCFFAWRLGHIIY